MTKELHLDSQDVAAYITKFCADENYFINLTKLQKLMYCVYGAVLSISDTRICDEHPKAWEHGPVFPRVYNFTKKHSNFIDALINRNEDVFEHLTEVQRKAIEATLKLFGKYSATTLVNWSHSEDGAWFKCTNGGRDLHHQEIPDELIADYFKKIIMRKKND